MSSSEADLAVAESLVPHLNTCARDPDWHDEFHCDCGTWEIHQSIAAALAAARHKGYVEGARQVLEATYEATLYG